VNETLAAGAFYLGVAALVVGAIRAARSAIEGPRRRGTPGFALIGAGIAGIAVAVAVFATGPRHVLPF